MYKIIDEAKKEIAEIAKQASFLLVEPNFKEKDNIIASIADRAVFLKVLLNKINK